MTPNRTTRVLILGGGFGGVYTALTLEKLLKRELRRGEIEIGLVSRDNYLTFQPMLPEVVSGSIGILDTIAPIRRLCPRTNLYTRAIEAIDLDRRRVTLAAGVGSRQLELECDHLVIALGSATSFAGQAGLVEHALPFKYLGDALALRNHAIHALEEADIEREPTCRTGLLTFVVAGGGFSGVEAVAELNDFVRSAARSFRNIGPEEIRIVLLHAGGLILPELPKSLAEFAQKLLMKRGVEVSLNSRLAGATAEADSPEESVSRPGRSSARCRRGPIPWWPRWPARRTRAVSLPTPTSKYRGIPGSGRWATAPLSWTPARAILARPRPNTPSARDGAPPRTSRQACGARRNALSPSRRSARWDRWVTARRSPRCSGSNSLVFSRGGSGAPCT
jgi:hypothetical protein